MQKDYDVTKISQGGECARFIWEIVFRGCRSQTMDDDVLDERFHTTNYESRVIDIKIREPIITAVRGETRNCQNVSSDGRTSSRLPCLNYLPRTESASNDSTTNMCNLKREWSLPTL